MATPLPFVLRVAAGVLAESLATVRRLPTELPTLPVTVMGQAAKLSFQLNQQLTELASAGDRLIASLQTPVEPPQRTAWSTIDEESDIAEADPQAAASWDSVPDLNGTDLPAAGGWDGDADLDTDAGPDVGTEPEELTRGLVEDVDRLENAVEPTQPTLALVPDYATLTLSQLRTRIRAMPADQVRAALEFEQTHKARPAFLTLLTNRLVTLARADQ